MFLYHRYTDLPSSQLHKPFPLVLPICLLLNGSATVSLPSYYQHICRDVFVEVKRTMTWTMVDLQKWKPRVKLISVTWFPLPQLDSHFFRLTWFNTTLTVAGWSLMSWTTDLISVEKQYYTCLLFGLYIIRLGLFQKILGRPIYAEEDALLSFMSILIHSSWTNGSIKSL